MPINLLCKLNLYFSMIEEQKKDIIDVLENVIKALEREDERDIKAWSNHIIHSASIFQDKYSVQLATAVYSLGKVLGNRYLMKNFPDKMKSFVASSKRYLKKAFERIKSKDIEGYYKEMSSLLALIGKTDARFGQYIEEVVRYAMVKKGSKIYAHGISMGRVAEILGISEWELMEHTGWIHEKDYPAVPFMDVNKRLKNAKELFS